MPAEGRVRVKVKGGRVRARRHVRRAPPAAQIPLSDESPDWGNRSAQSLGGSPVTLLLYVEDCDAVFAQALAAGATVQMPVSVQFWGDRMGTVVDPYGFKWMIGTHVEDLTPEQIAERAKAFMSAGGCGES